MQQDGTLFLWVTNRDRLLRFVQDELLPAWHLRHAATWVNVCYLASEMHRSRLHKVMALLRVRVCFEASTTTDFQTKLLFLIALQWWLKLEAGGARPVTPLHSLHRHPFEAVLLLRPAATADGQKQSGIQGGEQTQTGTEEKDDLLDGLVFMSVPSAEHSRKPHLGPLMDTLIIYAPTQSGGEGRRLELFAREMHEGWDSAGDEVLKFQQL